MTAVATAEPQIDLDQAQRFLARLDGRPDAQFTFQTFAERDGKAGGAKLNRVRHGTLAEYAAELSRLNEQGGGVFAAVNECDGKGRKVENVNRVRAVFLDFDNAETNPLELIELLRPVPHAVVESSPGKAHAYWAVNDCALDQFPAMQASLAEQFKAFGSDPKVKDLPRVMRLPGFIHRKDAAFQTRIVSITDAAPYTLAEIRAGLLQDGANKPQTPAANAPAPVPPAEKAKPTRQASTAPVDELPKIRGALDAIPAKEWDDRELWLKLGMAVHAYGTESGDLDECFNLWCGASRKSSKFDATDTRRVWESFRENKSGLTVATLYREAALHGWQIPRTARASRFKLEEDGVYYTGTDKNGEPLPALRICGFLTVTAQATDPDGNGWGLVLEFFDRDEVERTWVMPLDMLAGEAVEVRAELLRRGLWLAPGRVAREQLSEYLHLKENLPRATYTNVSGWHAGSYVTPAGTIGASNDGRRVLFRGAGGRGHFKVKGTTESWRGSVAALAAGNSRLTFAISTAFAAPLLHLVGIDSGGFHFGGDSSQGKTSIVRAAASVWGGPDYVRTWRATSNGLEGIACQHNDGLLILDEFNQVDAREAGEAAYMLANGKGKARAGKDGAARDSAKWRLLYLSTGEVGLAAHMSKAGARAEVGQEVRLVEITADAGAGFGIYETLNGLEGGAALSSALVAAAAEHHGAAGQAWLEHLSGHYAECTAEVRALIKTYSAAVLPNGAEGQAQRVAARFALVAASGEIATAQGLTGWAAGAALNAAKVCFTAWLDGRGGARNQERFAILNGVREFFERHGESRFQPKDARDCDRTISNRAGFCDKHATPTGGTVFYVLPSTFTGEMCKGKSQRSVTKVLIAEGWLIPGSGGKSAQAVDLPGMGKKRCYVFGQKALEADIA